MENKNHVSLYTGESVYLGGPMAGLTFYDALRWRLLATDIFESQYGITVVNPLRGLSTSYSPGDVFEPKGDDSPSIFSTSKGLVRRDLNDVRNAGVVFMNLMEAKQVSIGSMMEIAIAFENNIPVVVAMEDNNCHQHVFVHEMALIQNHFDKAIKTAASFLRNI